MQNNTMCMLQSNEDINIETTEPGPGSEIQVPESRSNTDIQIDFYHPTDMPYYRTYFSNSDHTTTGTILPIAPEDQRNTVERILIWSKK